MREPKRLAHRQAERNKARALKRWNWDDGDEDAAANVAVAVEAEPQPDSNGSHVSPDARLETSVTS